MLLKLPQPYRLSISTLLHPPGSFVNARLQERLGEVYYVDRAVSILLESVHHCAEFLDGKTFSANREEQGRNPTWILKTDYILTILVQLSSSQ